MARNTSRRLANRGFGRGDVEKVVGRYLPVGLLDDAPHQLRRWNPPLDEARDGWLLATNHLSELLLG